jgi:RNA polymerase sigma-70 factor (ECF subfamily)
MDSKDHNKVNESLRQELYQDICVAVWQALNGFRGDANIKTYLLRVAHNCCITYVTKEANRIKASEYKEQASERSADIASSEAASNVSMDIKPPSPEQTLIKDTQVQRLMHCVRQLGIPARQIITLSLEGLSYQEIADVTGLSVSNIGVTITRTKKELKRLMQS